jgi:ubiquinone biosynthesis monooxygenase Coq7
MENLLTSNEKSKLLFLWRIMGFVLGFLSAMFGYKFFCITVDAVETFVEKHYNEQIEYLLNNNLNYKLAMVLKKCCDEEIEHQQDARSKVLKKDEGKFTNFWKKIVGSGSNMAVNVSKLV